MTNPANTAPAAADRAPHRNAAGALMTHSRADFIAGLAATLANRSGFAAGKIGHTEQHWLYYPIFLDSRPTLKHRRAFELSLRFVSERQSGVYPGDPDFLLSFSRFHAGHLSSLDYLGLLGSAMESAIVPHYRLGAKRLPFQDMEPDRSIPTDPSQCYLDLFRGRRLLIVAPFAELLRERATRSTFEGTWQKTGKSWFHPSCVEAIEFPYGHDRATWVRFPTVLRLFEDIAERVSSCDFDVALIAAGGLGIPLASHVKSLGRVGISLGGHLQVLFGVIGKRWRDQPFWHENYFNEHWIDMPERYHPSNKDRVSDGGAYW